MINLPTLKYIFLISTLLVINKNSALAQITPDNTLGAESSRVVPNGSIDKIDGGALRDQNLFHSFKEFNINNGQSVYFSNPSGIENILTRVTGGNASNIFGTLGVDGAANLFLINPNGIVFGENARLDLGGSFVGTTANGLQFGEQGNFSATNPEAPGLLTVNPNALLFNQIQAGRIENRSKVPFGNDYFGLRVPDGQSLLFVGGDILINGGGLNAFGGQVELAGLAGDATVGLNIDGNNLSLTVPDNVAKGNISLNNRARVDVAGNGEGSITVNAQNLEIKESSFLFAGIRSGLGTSEAQAGDITINATDSVLFDNESYVSNNVKSGGFGKTEDVSIYTNLMKVLNGAELNASTFGEGDAGSVIINATDKVIFDGENKDGFASGAFSTVRSGAKGKAGGVEINAASLEVLNGAVLSTSTLGEGDAGSVTINATDKVIFDGKNKDGFASGASSSVASGAKGKAGGVEINAASLEVLNGALLDASTFGEGDAGSVTVNATDKVIFNGKVAAFSTVQSEAKGNAGSIEINTASLEVLNGALLDASTFGEGDAGSVTVNASGKVIFDGEVLVSSGVASEAKGKAGGVEINAASLEVLNGAVLEAITSGEGDAGSVIINATDKVIFDGEGGALSSVASKAEGKAGGVEINVASLEVINGAVLDASTLGEGDAGSVTVNATDKVIFDGEVRVSSSVASKAEGKAGGVEINAASLEVLNGAELNASTLGEGDAGSVTINATDKVIFDGEVAASSTVGSKAKGNGGGIEINTASLEALNSVLLDASTLGEGNAGSVTIHATDKVIFDGKSAASSIVAPGAEGNAGGIEIDAASLEVINSVITAATLGEGDAGKVEITAKTFAASNRGQVNSRTYSQFPAGNINLNVDKITLSGLGAGIFADTFEGSTGKGGSIIIDPTTFIIRDGAQISVNSDGEGIAGDIELDAGFMTLDNGTISAQTRSDTGGNITLNLKDVLLLRNGSQISTTAGNQQFGGDGGNININSPFIVALPNENSDITANAFTGRGGNVDIITQGIFGINPADKPTLQSDITASSETGIQGEISVTDPEIDPSQGLIELPTGLVDKSNQIAQTCPRGINAKKLSEFYITGKGSLPPNPLHILEGTYELSRLATLDGESGTEVRSGRIEKESKEIVEAQGFMKTENGEIYLVAEATSTTPSSNPTVSVCPTYTGLTQLSQDSDGALH